MSKLPHQANEHIQQFADIYIYIPIDRRYRDIEEYTEFIVGELASELLFKQNIYLLQIIAKWRLCLGL